MLHLTWHKKPVREHSHWRRFRWQKLPLCVTAVWRKRRFLCSNKVMNTLFPVFLPAIQCVHILQYQNRQRGQHTEFESQSTFNLSAMSAYIAGTRVLTLLVEQTHSFLVHTVFINLASWKVQKGQCLVPVSHLVYGVVELWSLCMFVT